VTRNPDQAAYPFGTVVTLTAVPAPGWSFSEWSGALSGNTNPESITIDADKVVTATFTLNTYTLMVNYAGNGSGSVAITYLGTLVLPPSTYAHGTVVTLTASANTGSFFVGWSGNLTGTTNPITFTMDADKVITATFTQNEYTLTVNTVGSGSVTEDPNQSTYHYGDVVTLTATPATGWAFTVWSGSLTGGTNPATITIDGNKTVTATFELAAINNPPIANAGLDQTVYINTSVTLNGSASTDPDGNLPLKFGWIQTGGPAVSFNRMLSVTTFTAPSTPQVLTFTLTVSDTLGLASAPDTVVLTVRNYSMYLPITMRN